MTEARRRASRSAFRATATVMLAAPFLSGCVAAALPVLAAGGIITTRGDDRSKTARPPVALPSQAVTASAGTVVVAPGTLPSPVSREVTYADGSVVTVTNALPTAREGVATVGPQMSAAEAEALAPSERDAFQSALTISPPVAQLTGLTELPPPSGYDGKAVASGAQAAFAAFAVEQAAIPVVGSERRSVLLADPFAMTPETRTCSIHPAAVLVDLDPEGTTIDLSRPLSGDRMLAEKLAALRAEGVMVGWTSSQTADRAGEVRKALVSSGLDPAGRDELVLLRFPEERKQTRRDEFARSHCVVAIAGDERADFDELFAYLRNPAAAAPLERLIGAGWFIIPAPLSPN